MIPSAPRPKISDDDLLAAVHTCGRVGDVASLHCCLRERLGLDLEVRYLTERLERLHRVGLVRVFQPHESDVLRYHLTENGVERLVELDVEPPKPPSA